jgi:hypothetical protein
LKYTSTFEDVLRVISRLKVVELEIKGSGAI